jgi:hypothetical protein
MRSSMAVTAALSPRSLPQSSTGRFEVSKMLARSWRRITISSKSWAAVTAKCLAPKSTTRDSFSLAGFQVTLIGRFWMTPERPTPKSAQFQVSCLVVFSYGSYSVWRHWWACLSRGSQQKGKTAVPRHSIRGATNPAPALTQYTGSKSIG